MPVGSSLQLDAEVDIILKPGCPTLSSLISCVCVCVYMALEWTDNGRWWVEGPVPGLQVEMCGGWGS